MRRAADVQGGGGGAGGGGFDTPLLRSKYFNFNLDSKDYKNHA